MYDALTELKRRYERLAWLHEVGRAANAAPGSPEALEVVLRAATRATRADASFVALINPTTGFLEIQAAVGLSRHVMERKLRVSEGVIGWVTRAGQPACVEDVTKDPRYVVLRPTVPPSTSFRGVALYASFCTSLSFCNVMKSIV